jgi:adenylate cyclase
LNAILQRAASGETHELSAVSIIGRSPECQIVIADPRVSRRHAMVRKQDGGFYLFDLGSFNGSYLNGSRVTAARQLRHGDVISFADHEFHYNELGETTSKANLEDLGGSTIALIRSTPVILLVSDIKGFTSLSEVIEADELAQIIGSWYSDCERILAEAGATVDKFIGDCVLAYWTSITPETLRASLRAAEQLLASCQRIYTERPDVFDSVGRNFEIGVALHTGKVAYGGMSQGEFTLVGDPVNLTFRLESLTRELGRSVLVSGDFIREWPDLRGHCNNHGVHRVKGRAQGVEVFSLNGFPPA